MVSSTTSTSSQEEARWRGAEGEGEETSLLDVLVVAAPGARVLAARDFAARRRLASVAKDLLPKRDDEDGDGDEKGVEGAKQVDVDVVAVVVAVVVVVVVATVDSVIIAFSLAELVAFDPAKLATARDSARSSLLRHDPAREAAARRMAVGPRSTERKQWKKKKKEK